MKTIKINKMDESIIDYVSCVIPTNATAIVDGKLHHLIAIRQKFQFEQNEVEGTTCYADMT